MDKDTQIRQLMYRSWHRGCKETDLLLGEFAKAKLEKMNSQELEIYTKFLEEDDVDIYAWSANPTKAPTQYSLIIGQINLIWQKYLNNVLN